MDAHQEIENIDEVEKQSLVHFAHQANKTELTNTTGTQLQHMNEDCLLEIFSSKSLTPMDLWSLAKTCTRFEQITQRVFPKALIIKVDRKGDLVFKSKDYLASNTCAHDVERIFKNFGSCISALSFKGYDKGHVSDLLTKYCVGTLERLRIQQMKIPEVLAVQLKPIFQQLQQLVFYCVTIEGDNNLFDNCVSLTELVVSEVTNSDAILENIFPKLERFRFRCTKDELRKYVNEHLLSAFVSRHKSLKTLNLVTDPNVKVSWTGHILQTIRNTCKELEELEMDITPENDLFELHALDQLKQLTVQFSSVNATVNILQLQALKSLEILKIKQLRGGFGTELIQALALLTNLRELHLMGCDGRRDYFHHSLFTQLMNFNLLNTYDASPITTMVDIIKRLTNLRELIMDYDFVLLEETFCEIVEIVKERPHRLTLKCKFGFFYNSKNCDENQNVKLMKI